MILNRVDKQHSQPKPMPKKQLTLTITPSGHDLKFTILNQTDYIEDAQGFYLSGEKLSDEQRALIDQIVKLSKELVGESREETLLRELGF